MRLTRFGRAVLIQALLGAIAVGALAWRVDLLAALRGLPQVQPGWVAAALGLFTASKVLHAGRWRLLLRHRPEVPSRDLVALFLVSNLVNAVAPLRLGDLIRIELPSRRYGVPRTELASNVVVVESLFDGVAYVLLILAALAIAEVPAVLRPALGVAGAAILVLFVLAAGAARTGWGQDAAASPLLRPLSTGVRAGVARRLGDVLRGMASLRSGRDATAGLAISVAGWLLEVGVYCVLARAFGLHLTFSQALLVTVAANLAVAVPLTPWNVGPFELVLSELLVLLGVARPAAAEYAVGSHVLLMAWIGATGLAAMWALRLRWSELRRETGVSPRPRAAPREEANE